MDDRPALLFCETFNHENDPLNVHLDMVGFFRPVSITEIRVIPQGCKVHPEISDRLGETNPSSFKLDLFLKNLAQPDAHVFEVLGSLDYEQGKSIQQIVNSKVATNAVLVRGWYKSLTVSLYGTFSNFVPDPNIVPPPPPPIEPTPRPLPVPVPVGMDGHVQVSAPPTISHSMPAVVPPMPPPMYIQTPPLDGNIPHNALPPHIDSVNFGSPSYGNHSPHSDLERRDVNNFQRTVEPRVDAEENRRPADENRRGFYGQMRGDDNFNRDQQREPQSTRQSGKSDQQSMKGNTDSTGQPIVPSEELFEPLSPENDFFEGNNEDSANRQKTTVDGEQIGYEDIDSDEDDMLEDFDFEDHNLTSEFDTDETWASISVSFNPYQCSLSPLQFIPSFIQTDFERMLKGFKSGKDLKEPAQVKQLQDHIVSDSEAERDSKWVTMLEELPTILPVAMAYLHSQPSQKIKERHFLSIITEWAIFGLNIDNALNLPLAVNIRFLKASIKLTCLLARSCSEYQRMLIELDVQERLIELLKTNHMASSLKLLILKALDATTNSAFGMENFLGWNLEPTENDEEMPSVYEELVLYLISQPTVRIITAIQALLSKAHFYESISAIQSISAKIFDSPVKVLLEEAESEAPREENSVGKDKLPKKSIELSMTDKDLSRILSALQNVHNIIECGNSVITQPSIRSFPTTSRLQEEPIEDCFPTIVSLMTSRRFLESMLIIMSSPLFCEPGVFIGVRDILFLLMNSYKGLLYISSQPNIANALIRVLLEVDCGYADAPSLRQCIMNEELRENCTAHHLGVMLVYHLQTIQGVDQLLETAKPNLALGAMDSSDHISMLHTLYAMTYTNAGRDAVTSTLSFGDHLKCLLPFLCGGEDFETKMKKSVSSKYAAVLLLQTLQHSNSVDYLERFSSQLLTIPKKDNDRTLEDIHLFLAPLEKVPSYDINAINNLIDFIKNEIDDVKLSSGINRSILTTLRLLKYFIKTTEDQGNPQKDLAWRLSVIQMFSSNAMGVLILLMRKISEQLVMPWKLQEPFSNNQFSIFITITRHILELIDVLLTHLLPTSFCFKDSRLVTELFSLHKILCSKPPVGPLTCILTTIQEQIIALLIKFMKGTTEAPSSEEAVKASTWYILLKELLTFTVAKPENFITGLVLISELLPTPLPIHTLHNIGGNKMAHVMNYRLYVMANFSCLSSELKLMVRTVVASCSSTLQYYFRRVLCQLIDLGATVAGLVLRTLCEIVDEYLIKAGKESEDTSDEKDDEKEKGKKKQFSGTFYNTFSLLSYLACQPSGKAAFLTLLVTSKDSVTEFPDFIEKLISVQQKETSLSLLENSLLPIFQSICDHEVCLEVFNGCITWQHLSNTLPIESTLKSIVEFLFSLISNESLSFHIILRSLNILESLTDHDYGMIIIKRYLSKKGGCLTVLLDRLVSNVENKTELSLVFNTISTYIEFLNLTNSPGPENYMKDGDDMKMDDNGDKVTDNGDADAEKTEGKNNGKVQGDRPLQRSVFIGANMLKTIFTLDEKNISEHALTKLERLIEDEGQDEEDLVSLSQAITTLRMIMIAGEQKHVESETERHIKLLPAVPLHTQFGARLTQLKMNTIHDDRATSNDWFDAAPPDEIDLENEVETVKLDLLAISEKFLPNFKFKEEIEKGFVDTAEMKRSKRSKRNGFFRAGDHIEDSKRRRFDVSALGGQPNNRNTGGAGGGGGGGNRGANRGSSKGFFGRGFKNFNRGFGRGFNRGRGRGRGGDIDMFRQRRQNTSRPPSMHVDDFVNMEKGGSTQMAVEGNEDSNNAQTSNEERFTNNSNGNSQGRWNSQSNGNFRRNNNTEAIQTIQTSRVNNDNYDYNSRNQGGNSGSGGSGGGKFHNRSASDWNNSNNYRGSREPNYTKTGGARGGGSGGGGYWSGAKSKDDGRFFNNNSNNYRQFGRGGRHQRTFTR